MKHLKSLCKIILPVLLLVAGNSVLAAPPVGTGFTYQGDLLIEGAHANGNFDLTFELYDDPTAGAQVGTTQTNVNVVVSNGLFTTTVDFGPGVFDGAAYWLLVGVRSNGVAAAFSPMLPRQPVTATPYALFAAAAPVANNSVGSAQIVNGSITSADLAPNSVNTTHIIDGQVMNADVANGAVDSAKVLDGSLLGADMAPNTVTSIQLADVIALGDSTTSGQLDIFRNSTGTPSISLAGGSSQISTYGSDGLEQIRLWGSGYGELLLHNSLVNNATAVTLSANGGVGGYLSLNNSNGLARASLLGNNTGGILNLYSADGSLGVIAYGESSGAGLVNILNTNGSTRLTLDGSGAGTGGQITLYNGAGSARMYLYGDSVGGALQYLYAADGSLGIALDGDSGGAGYIAVYNTNGSTRVSIDGFNSTTTGGEISVYDASSTETLELLGAASTTLGGKITARQADGSVGVEIYAEAYAADGGLVSIKNAAGTEKIELDGDDGDGGAAIRLHNSAGTTTITIDADLSGDGRITTQELSITGGSDLSEQFDITPLEDTVKPGMVVCIDPKHPGQLIPCSQSYDRTVAGVVSGAGGVKPGMLMGQRGTAADGLHPVALTGRVYCWADASKGAIQPGDLITTSDTPGHAMKASDHSRAMGTILGKAMTSLDHDKGLVLVLVSLQ